MVESHSHLDLSGIDFPSDRVTIGQIRREQPEYFEDYLPAQDHGLSALNIASTVAMEVSLAKNAYSKATGGAHDRISTSVRRERIEALHDDYVDYGISNGLAQTKELIRALERDAVKQAKQQRS
jgi:hypothetical protein